MGVIVYNLQIIHFQICFSKSLDKGRGAMVKYLRIEYRIDRKEYSAENLREFGSLAESPNGRRRRKVRPGANAIKK